MLMVMNVTAGEDCVMAPASVPQPKAAKRLSARRLASTRRRGPTTVLRFSERSHIPKNSSPTPPRMPPNTAIIRRSLATVPARGRWRLR